MEAQLPTNTCCFCRETFRGYGKLPKAVRECVEADTALAFADIEQDLPDWLTR